MCDALWVNNSLSCCPYHFEITSNTSFILLSVVIQIPIFKHSHPVTTEARLLALSSLLVMLMVCSPLPLVVICFFQVLVLLTHNVLWFERWQVFVLWLSVSHITPRGKETHGRIEERISCLMFFHLHDISSCQFHSVACHLKDQYQERKGRKSLSSFTLFMEHSGLLAVILCPIVPWLFKL